MISSFSLTMDARMRNGAVLSALGSLLLGLGAFNSILFGAYVGTNDLSPLTISPPDLDSFSEPSTAAAILRSRAKALHEACAEALGALSGSKAGSLQIRATEWIIRYQEELNRQEEIRKDGNLEHGLLILYKVCNRREEFLDCYLRLLADAPDHPVVRGWAGYALTCAQTCARTAEVLDALQHLARFDRDRDVANKVKDQIAKWTAEHPSLVPANLNREDSMDLQFGYSGVVFP